MSESILRAISLDEPVNIMNSEDFRQYCLDTGSHWLYYIPDSGWEKAWIQLKYAQTHFVRGYYETGTYPPDPSRPSGNVWVIYRKDGPAKYRDYDVKEDPEGYLNRCHCYSPDVLTYSADLVAGAGHKTELCITCQTLYPDAPRGLTPKQIQQRIEGNLRVLLE